MSRPLGVLAGMFLILAVTLAVISLTRPPAYDGVTVLGIVVALIGLALAVAAASCAPPRPAKGARRAVRRL